MSYVLKSISTGGYILAAPRRAAREGCTITEEKLYAKKRLSFPTEDDARAWMRALRERQLAAGCKRYQLAYARPEPC